MGRYTAEYTSAQTGAVLVSVASGEGFVMTGYSVRLSAAGPNITSYTLEWDDTVDVVIGGHPGVARGSGDGEKATSDTYPIAEGADGQDLLFKCADPGTGGKIRVMVNGYKVSFV